MGGPDIGVVDVKRCSCGAWIDFIRTEKGRKMPVDAKPVRVRLSSAATEQWITRDGRMVRGTLDEDGASVVWRPHWTVCPHAETRWRQQPRQAKDLPTVPTALRARVTRLELQLEAARKLARDVLRAQHRDLEPIEEESLRERLHQLATAD